MELRGVITPKGAQQEWFPFQENAGTLALESELAVTASALARPHIEAQRDYMDSLYPPAPATGSHASRIANVLRRIFSS